MYMTPIGSFSGVVHLIAKRPYIVAVVATVALAIQPTRTMTAPLPNPPAVITIPGPPIVAMIPEAPTTQQPCQVDVPQPGVVRQIANCYFQYSAPPHGADGLGARVDNVCKHKLDDTILYLKQRGDNILLEGNSLTGHGSIAMSRARNVKAYLVANGIDSQRITIKRGLKHSRVVDLIVSGAGK